MLVMAASSWRRVRGPCLAETGAALPLLQRLPQHIGEKAHQDVRQHAILALMPDGTDRQLALIDAKGRFRFRKLNIGPPQRLGAPSRADWCAARSSLRCDATSRPIPPVRLDHSSPAQASRQDLVVDELDRIARAARELRPSRRPIWRSAAPRSIGFFRAPPTVSLQARQGGLDALAEEARVHRLFLLLSLGRTHRKECLAPIRAGADLGFDPVAHLPPSPADRQAGRRTSSACSCSRRSNSAVDCPAARPCSLLSARHAAIHHPYAARLTIAALHRGQRTPPLSSRRCDCRRTPHSRAARRPASPPSRCRPVSLPHGRLRRSRGERAHCPRLGPRNTCSSHHTAGAHSRDRTTFPGAP